MFSRLVGSLIALLVSCSALAAGTCYQFQANRGIAGVVYPYLEDRQAAVDWTAANCSESTSRKVQCIPSATDCNTTALYTCGDVTGSVQPGTTWPAATYSLVLTVTVISTGATSTRTYTGGTISNRTDPNGCPECPSAGTQLTAGFPTAMSSGDVGCTSGGCEIQVTSPTRWMIVQGGSQYVASAQTTGNACQQIDSATHDEADDTTECYSSSDGVVACSQPQDAGRGCGYYNGDYICTSGQQANTCAATPSGAMFCVTAPGSSTLPPGTPDSGTPGDPADASVTGTYGTQTWNYYSASTVQASTTYNSETGATNDAVEQVAGEYAPGVTPTGSGAGGGAGTTIVCESGSTDCGTVEAEEVCMPGEECAGDLPDVGAEGDCTFTECAQDFYNRVSDAPILAAVSGVSAAFPTGSCPTWTLEAFGENYSLSAPMCSIWEDVSPFLSGVMLLVWGWVATRIVLSA